MSAPTAASTHSTIKRGHGRTCSGHPRLRGPRFHEMKPRNLMHSPDGRVPAQSLGELAAAADAGNNVCHRVKQAVLMARSRIYLADFSQRILGIPICVHE